MKIICVLLSVLLLAACPADGPDGLDLDPPRLLGTDLPVSGVVSPTATIRVRFSEPLAPEAATGEVFVVVPHEQEGACSTDLSCAEGASCHADQCQRDPVDPAWIADMASPPLCASRQQRVAPYSVELEQGGAVVALRCLRPLDPLRLHALLVGPGVADRAGNRILLAQDERLALRKTFATGEAASGRPTVWLRSPPPRSADLPCNLARVVVRFSRPVSGVSDATLGLELAPGQPVATTLAQGSPRCRKLEPGSCHELRLSQILPARARVALRVGAGIHDAAGRALLPPTGQDIATGDWLDRIPPATNGLRVEQGDGCVVARLRAEEQTDLMLEGDWGDVAESSVGGIEHEVALRAPSAPGQLTVTVEDLAGNRAAIVQRLRPSAAPRVAITEVLANPAGAEPAQELVELVNLSGTSVDLGSWSLDDKNDGLAPCALPSVDLAPGQVAVVVGKGYQELGAADPAPAEGALLVRLPGLLGESGLANTGEAVALRDDHGRLASSYSNQLGPVSGKAKGGSSVQRVVAGACDVRANWRLAPATPGRAP